MTRARRLLAKFMSDTGGATAAEFVLVLPVMIVMIFGVINICTMVYGVVTLNWAVQDAARCRAVKTTVCTDATTTQNYAASAFVGPISKAAFISTTDATCSTVSATGKYTFTTGLVSYPVDISASACYPLQP